MPAANLYRKKGVDFLLTAKLSNGKIITVAEKNNLTFLRHLRKQEKFYCRQCGERVILKLGSKRIPHFAHEKGSPCLERFEPESEYHNRGKLYLYEWLQQNSLSPQLEVYYPAILQRADVVFAYNGKTYCIEFQCASISEQEFIKRTKGYQRLSLNPLWILGGKNIFRKNRQKYSLSAFHYLFLQKTSSNQLYLPAFCPETDKFIFLANIMPVSVRTSLANIFIKPRNFVSVNDLLAPSFPSFPSVDSWREEMKQFKTTFFIGKHIYNSPFLKELYSLSVNPRLLPPYVGIPLPSNPVIEESPFIWQTYIYIDLLAGRKQGQSFSFSDVNLSVLKRIRKNQLHLRSFPNIKQSLLPFVLAEYMHCLVKAGVLIKGDGNTFYIPRDIVPYCGFGGFEKEEERFYLQFSFQQNFDGREYF